MATTEFCWDSFPPKELEGVAKDQKTGGNDHKTRRHDDLPRYNAPTDGNRKPRGPPFNNRNNSGGQQRISESKHDNRGGNQFNNNIHNGNNNRGPIGQRKQRTASDSYEGDRPKSGPPKSHNNNNNNNNLGNGNGRTPFRNSNSTSQRDQDHDIKHRSTQANVKSDKESNAEKDLRLQIMRMKGHMLYLKDQNAYKDQVIHHKDQVILALRNKLEKLKAGSSAVNEPSTSPVEPKKPDDIDKMEADLATEDLPKDETEQQNGHKSPEENGQTQEEKKEEEEVHPECGQEQPNSSEEQQPKPEGEEQQQPCAEESQQEQPKCEEQQPEQQQQQPEEQPKPEEEQPKTEENPPTDQCTSSEGEKPPAPEGEQPVLTENNC